MGQRVVVLRVAVGVHQAVDVGGVRAADDVVGPVVLHVHQEDVIERVDLRGQGRHRNHVLCRRIGRRVDTERDVVGVGVVVVAEDRVEVLEGDDHLRALRAVRNDAGDAASLQPGLEQAAQCGHWFDLGAADEALVGIEEVDLHRRPRRVNQVPAEIRAQGEVQPTRVLTEVHRLTERRGRDVSAAKELIVTARRSGLREAQELRQQNALGAQEPRKTTLRAVLDHCRCTRHLPARHSHRAVPRQGRISDFGSRVGQQIATGERGRGRDDGRGGCDDDGCMPRALRDLAAYHLCDSRGRRLRGRGGSLRGPLRATGYMCGRDHLVADHRGGSRRRRRRCTGCAPHRPGRGARSRRSRVTVGSLGGRARRGSRVRATHCRSGQGDRHARTQRHRQPTDATDIPGTTHLGSLRRHTAATAIGQHPGARGRRN